MALRSGSLSRSLISTARASSLRSSPPLPRIRPPSVAAPRVQPPRRLPFAAVPRSPETLTYSPPCLVAGKMREKTHEKFWIFICFTMFIGIYSFMLVWISDMWDMGQRGNFNHCLCCEKKREGDKGNVKFQFVLWDRVHLSHYYFLKDLQLHLFIGRVL